jgi:hypothetical protein
MEEGERKRNTDVLDYMTPIQKLLKLNTLRSEVNIISTHKRVSKRKAKTCATNDKSCT